LSDIGPLDLYMIIVQLAGRRVKVEGGQVEHEAMLEGAQAGVEVGAWERACGEGRVVGLEEVVKHGVDGTQA